MPTHIGLGAFMDWSPIVWRFAVVLATALCCLMSLLLGLVRFEFLAKILALQAGSNTEAESKVGRNGNANSGAGSNTQAQVNGKGDATVRRSHRFGCLHGLASNSLTLYCCPYHSFALLNVIVTWTRAV
jgi:hypothetical protein